MFLSHFYHVSGDVAYYQPATQSETHTGTSGLPRIAAYAVDYDPLYQTCAFANNIDLSPACWRVDLGDLYSVTSASLLATTAGRMCRIILVIFGYNHSITIEPGRIDWRFVK